ncbi:MAG TPA: VWA domain-containing protein [Thermoanaerobaculia bacterium]|nr:VWA domain-containing protein [Thermoanaerobaculia bacterium]
MRAPVRSPARSAALRRLPPWLAVVLLALAAAPAFAVDSYGKKERQAIEALPQVHRTWLAHVEPIITEEELAAFLALEQDYQRDAFVKQFWRTRDPYPDTARNEYQDRYEQMIQDASNEYGSLTEDRARMLLLNGRPAAVIVGQCSGLLKPLEAWYYRGSDQTRREFFLIFYREGQHYRLWRPFEGINRLLDTLMADAGPTVGGGAAAGGSVMQSIVFNCRDGEKIAAAIAFASRDPMDYERILAEISDTPEPRQGEWVATFESYSTDLPPDAPRLPAELSVAYPARRQSRTVLQGTVTVPKAAAGTAELSGFQAFNLLLTGEVLSGEELFDTFRYKFDLPAEEVTGDKLPLVFTRYLRPGEYRLVLKLEDVNAGAFWRGERAVTVPRVERNEPPPPEDEETARLLAEANAALAAGGTSLQLLEPQGQIHTGYVRFDTLVTGEDVARVTFTLDDEPILTKNRPPYSVDLDLGETPRPRTLVAVAFDGQGEEVARDELPLNAGGHRFDVDLVEPRKGRTYRGSLAAEARVEVPEGQTLDRVEVFLNETRVATLYQEPWVQPIVLPEPGAITYVRMVAYLADGNSTEDLVFVNAPEYLEEIDVQLVEVFATALDRGGRPVEGLTEADFTVREDGQPQTLVRFEQVRDLPVHTAILLDVSASMEESLEAAQQAALRFLERTVQPKDRAAVITFNDHPHLAVKFTNDTRALAGGLAGLKAERGTALYDSLLFGLYYFNGIKGQRALLVLSDGKDESSRFDWERTLEAARRGGVALYTIALSADADKKKLERLAEATGGRSFAIGSPDELDAVYATIERELRSKYLLAYQSTATGGTKFRRIDVAVARPGVEVKAMRGYYP